VADKESLQIPIVIAITQGFGQELSNDGLFYAFDVLLLFFAISVYVPRAIHSEGVWSLKRGMT
jgi:hypothetical protein